VRDFDLFLIKIFPKWLPLGGKKIIFAFFSLFDQKYNHMYAKNEVSGSKNEEKTLVNCPLPHKIKFIILIEIA